MLYISIVVFPLCFNCRLLRNLRQRNVKDIFYVLHKSGVGLDELHLRALFFIETLTMARESPTKNKEKAIKRILTLAMKAFRNNSSIIQLVEMESQGHALTCLASSRDQSQSQKKRDEVFLLKKSLDE